MKRRGICQAERLLSHPQRRRIMCLRMYRSQVVADDLLTVQWCGQSAIDMEPLPGPMRITATSGFSARKTKSS